MSNSKPIFAYYDMRGLGYPIKLELAYLGIDYVDKRYPITQAGLDQYRSDKANLGLDFPNVPYWKHGDINLTETRAILKYIAREEGGGKLMPTDRVGLANAEMLEGVLWDVWWFLINRCYRDTDDVIEELGESPAKFEMLDKFLRNKEWLLGDKISYVDFMLYEILYQYNVYDSEYLGPYGALLKLKANFEGLPAIKKFMASPEYMAAPCYHPLYMRYKAVGLTC